MGQRQWQMRVKEGARLQTLTRVGHRQRGSCSEAKLCPKNCPGAYLTSPSQQSYGLFTAPGENDLTRAQVWTTPQTESYSSSNRSHLWTHLSYTLESTCIHGLHCVCYCSCFSRYNNIPNATLLGAEFVRNVQLFK